MKKQHTHYITAIDIAKDSLRVQSTEYALDLSNDRRGFATLARRLRGQDKPLVVFEATGGYERPLADFLHERGIALVVVNPRRLRAFARSEGMNAKSDPIDARMILRFAIEKGLRPTPPPGPRQRQLADLLDRRNQLAATLASEKNRLQKGNGPAAPITRSIGRIIKTLEKEIATLEAAIRKLVEGDSGLKAAAEVITEVRGVGEVTAWSVMAWLAEIDQLNRRELAALVGVAPFDDDSGKHAGRRYIQGGRAKVRNALYMAAHAAARWNPVIKAYVEGLMARGKPYKCAIVAAMRKLIIHIQSRLKAAKISLA